MARQTNHWTGKNEHRQFPLKHNSPPPKPKLNYASDIVWGVVKVNSIMFQDPSNYVSDIVWGGAKMN